MIQYTIVFPDVSEKSKEIFTEIFKNYIGKKIVFIVMYFSPLNAIFFNGKNFIFKNFQLKYSVIQNVKNTSY